jgi:hypothetical protein
MQNVNGEMNGMKNKTMNPKNVANFMNSASSYPKYPMQK